MLCLIATDFMIIDGGGAVSRLDVLLNAWIIATFMHCCYTTDRLRLMENIRIDGMRYYNRRL